MKPEFGVRLRTGSACCAGGSHHAVYGGALATCVDPFPPCFWPGASLGDSPFFGRSRLSAAWPSTPLPAAVPLIFLKSVTMSHIPKSCCLQEPGQSPQCRSRDFVIWQRGFRWARRERGPTPRVLLRVRSRLCSPRFSHPLERLKPL